jgi:hypothetical protein
MSKRFNFNHFDPGFIKERIHIISAIINSRKRTHVFITGNSEHIQDLFTKENTFIFEIEGRKRKATISYKKAKDGNSDNCIWFHLPTYKAQGFTGKQMQAYGAQCKLIYQQMS